MHEGEHSTPVITPTSIEQSSAMSVLAASSSASSASTLEARRGRPRGRRHSEASKKKIGLANRGNVPWNKGRPHSEATKRKIAENTRRAMLCPELRQVLKKRAIGRKHSEETKLKIARTARLARSGAHSSAPSRGATSPSACTVMTDGSDLAENDGAIGREKPRELQQQLAADSVLSPSQVSSEHQAESPIKQQPVVLKAEQEEPVRRKQQRKRRSNANQSDATACAGKAKRDVAKPSVSSNSKYEDTPWLQNGEKTMFNTTVASQSFLPTLHPVPLAYVDHAGNPFPTGAMVFMWLPPQASSESYATNEPSMEVKAEPTPADVEDEHLEQYDNTSGPAFQLPFSVMGEDVDMSSFFGSADIADVEMDSITPMASDSYKPDSMSGESLISMPEIHSDKNADDELASDLQTLNAYYDNEEGAIQSNIASRSPSLCSLREDFQGELDIGSSTRKNDKCHTPLENSARSNEPCIMEFLDELGNLPLAEKVDDALTYMQLNKEPSAMEPSTPAVYDQIAERVDTSNVASKPSTAASTPSEPPTSTPKTMQASASSLTTSFETTRDNKGINQQRGEEIEPLKSHLLALLDF